MANWKGNNPPEWQTKIRKDAVATKRGWENPDTREIIIQASNLNTRMGAADVIKVEYVDSSLVGGDEISVKVKFNEKVDVSAGASLVVTSTGISGNITLYALAQSGSYLVLFDKDITLSSNVVVPSETAILSISAQTVSGTIKDFGTVVDSNKDVSAQVAAEAGTISIP